MAIGAVKLQLVTTTTLPCRATIPRRIENSAAQYLGYPPRRTCSIHLIFRIEKEPVWRAVYHASRVRVPNLGCRRVWAIKPSQRSGTYPGGESYCLSNRPRPSNLCKSCLPTFAGKLDFGCVGATSSIDLSILFSTGVARKAWVSPACVLGRTSYKRLQMHTCL